jgi:ATP-dependent Clp protease adapter protein ClpS
MRRGPWQAAAGSGDERSEGDVGLLDDPAAADPVPERRFLVILFNDDDHTFDEVEFQLQKATGCSLEQAAQIAMTTHHEGRAVCFAGERDVCRRVADVLGEIRLLVDVVPDGGSE